MLSLSDGWRMNVACDLDDVIADLVPRLIEMHADMTGVRLTREQVTDWDVFPEALHVRARTDGTYGRLPLLPGAREFLEWLRQAGHRVFIVTFRGEPSRAITTEWLDRHVPRLYESVHLTGGSKVDACRALGVELIIDDSAQHVQAVTGALAVPGVLLDTPMNRHLPESRLVRRALTHEHARSIIEELALAKEYEA